MFYRKKLKYTNVGYSNVFMRRKYLKTLFVKYTMSSSRSVAAARARRAGGDSGTLKQQQLRNPQYMQNSQQQQQQQQQRQQQQQSVGSSQSIGQPANSPDTRLSVSDAFALVTIRLGRVETILQKLDMNDVAKKMSGDDDESVSTNISSVIIKSMVSRMDDLENKATNGISVEEHDEVVSILEEKVSTIEEEMRQLKDTLFKLQTMTLDINHRLVSSSVSTPSVNSNDTDNSMVPMDVVDETSASQDQSPPTFSAKEISAELSGDPAGVEEDSQTEDDPLPVESVEEGVSAEDSVELSAET
mgnify:CR=1 FL=1